MRTDRLDAAGAAPELAGSPSGSGCIRCFAPHGAYRNGAAEVQHCLFVLVLNVCRAGVGLQRLFHVAVFPVGVEAVGQVPVHRLLEAILPRHLQTVCVRLMRRMMQGMRIRQVRFVGTGATILGANMSMCSRHKLNRHLWPLARR